MTLHLTGCWYPDVDDATTRALTDVLVNGDLRLVWGNDVDALPHLNRLCADALERMAGTPKETPDAA